VLKVRVMPTLLYKNFGLVKGVAFDSWRRVGGVMQAIKVYNMREVDELVFLDITATIEERRPDFPAIDEFADECFMPMTVGGGVRSVDDVERLLKVGADKVAINTGAFDVPGLIEEAAQRFGAQCIVAAIDARRLEGGRYEVFTAAGTRTTGQDPVAAARAMAEAGAGEILLTSIDRDGTMQGYDLHLVRSVTQAVNIPVIASGGAGTYHHLLEALTTGGASAVAAASIFHFTEQTPRAAKEYLAQKGILVRL
jgi:cyclase